MKKLSIKAISQKGFIHITVIWGLGLLTLLMLSFVVTSFNHRKTTINMLENARAESFADAGVKIAILDLVNTAKLLPDKWRFSHNGQPISCSLQNKAILSISVQDEEGKIDLNTAGEGLLRALMTSLGLDEKTAGKYVDHIIDFRDTDNVRRLNGAEQAEYTAANLSYGPKNFPFQHVTELDQVVGLPSSVVQRIMPFVTIYSKRAGFDISVIPKAMLETLNLTGIDTTNKEPQQRSTAENPAKTNLRIYALASQRQTFSITVQAKTDIGGYYTRHAVISLSGQKDKPYNIKLWERSRKTDAIERISISSLEPC